MIQDGKKTNIVIERANFGHFYEIFGVLKDNRDTDPSRRYKMGFLSIQRDYHGEYEDPYHLGSRRGLGAAVSPDGIHWTMENEFASYEICDIGRFFWDSLTERYVLYGRTYRHGPYNGKDSGPSSCHIGLAKIKRGRFVSLEASFDGGMVLTKPLIFRGPQLFINANAEFGSIQVTLLDDQENQIPGWQSTISGEDNIRIPVNFEQSSVADLSDRCIRIQFVLKNAQISGFCVQ